MNSEEKKIVDNIANKVDFILYKDKVTIRTLAKLLSIDNQPLYRIMKREHIPNFTFLKSIANYLKCSILELMDNKYLLDINVYTNINYSNNCKPETYRVHICEEDFKNIVDHEFFGIIENSFIKIFYKTNKITTDGFYLSESENGLKELNIISVGTNLIFALINNKEIRFNPNEIQVNAKLYTTISVIQSDQYALKIT